MMIKTLTHSLEAISGKILWIDRFHLAYYTPIIKNELALLDHLPSRILFIGGGAAPYSPWLLYSKTRADITVIDNCKLRKIHGENFLTKQNINLNMLCHDGTSVNVDGYDLIVVAKQVNPKCRVLNHILSNADAGTDVLVRINKTEQLTHSPIKTIKHRKRQTSQTYRYIVT